MASSATFTVTNPQAPRLAVSRNIADIAGQVAASAASNTPQRTGRMARSWRTVPGREPGTTLVVNDTEYARFVEYGTRHMRAAAPLGRAMAGAR
jgi:hypothetical protein